MSQTYKIEVEVIVPDDANEDRRRAEVLVILNQWGFEPDNADGYRGVGTVNFWGERSLGGRGPEEAHAELLKVLPGSVTRWRCIDYDEWDEVIGEVECDECGQNVNESTAHNVQGKVIGDECCWDERLATVQ